MRMTPRRMDAALSTFDTASLFRLWPTASFISHSENAEYTSLFSEIMKKQNLEHLGHIGRAYCSAELGKYDEALQSILEAKVLISNRSVSQSTTRFVQAMHARALQGQAYIAATESQSASRDVCSTKNKYLAELQLAADNDTKDFTLSTALGEDMLEHAPASAIAALQSADMALKNELKECVASVVPFCSENRDSALTIYMQMWASTMSEKTSTASSVGGSLRDFVNSSHKYEKELKKYRNTRDLSSLSLSELHAVLAIEAAIATRDNGFARVCRAGQIPYKHWDGQKASDIVSRMDTFSGNISAKNQKNLDDLEAMIKNLSASDTSGEQNDMPRLDDVTRANFLNKTAGKPNSPLRKLHSDPNGELQALLSSIDKVYGAMPTHDVHSEGFQSAQKILLIDLLKQQRNRIQLAMGIALSRTGKEQEALNLLTNIIEEDAFLPMHQVFTARASIYQSVGESAKSDTDFREAFRLKIATVDIPSVDVNTQRRSF